MVGQCLFIVSTHEVFCHGLQVIKTCFSHMLPCICGGSWQRLFFQVRGHFISTRRGEFSASNILNVYVLVGHLLVSKGVKMT